MAIFSFKAYNDQGIAYQSKLEALSLSEAKKHLMDQGVQLVCIEKNKFKHAPSVPLSIVLSFTKELSQLLEAGLPLFESLALLKEQFAKERISNILYSLSESLESGSSFSNALLEHPKCFTPLYCSLVEVGEQSGRLDQALNKIIKEYERQNKLKKQVQSALLYPCILIVFCILLIHLMILYIVPSLENLFDGKNGHVLTQMIIELSHHLKRWEIFYLALFSGLALLIKWKLKGPELKPKLDAFLLKIPLVKSFILDCALSKFSSTMSMLLNGGVPLLESLSLCKNLISNKALRAATYEIERKIHEGQKLSDQLIKQPLFPPLFNRILSIGESSGELPKSFEKLAQIYEENVEKKLSKLMTLLSPIILLIMGVIIGCIMLGILIPLTDINSISI